MADLRSKHMIVLKGVLFALIVIMAAYLLYRLAPSLRTAALIAVLAWTSARFYYFLFYVLERYVDPTLRYAGVWAILKELLSRAGQRRA